LTSSGRGPSRSSPPSGRRCDSATPGSQPPVHSPLPISWSLILARHSSRYPLMRAQDIYKLVHQGVYGPGHLVASESDVRASLTSELQALATQCRVQNAECRRQNGGEEELVEEIDLRGRLVRVNLRPLVFAAEVRSQKPERRRQNLRGEWLVGAMVDSARRVKGDPKQMKRRLAAAVRWCRRNLPRQAAELERLSGRAEASGFPALHHSPAYRRAYRPAYRVILGSCLRSRASGRAG
jgi:hypothetical protein